MKKRRTWALLNAMTVATQAYMRRSGLCGISCLRCLQYRGMHGQALV
ncbi:hypothetical protein HMPREF0658_0733 [Hoylesella marshii DSM 16973 = JCM 13450]|uniref:Uncharacterized protein n=1 Tax=Hoylesella marshii DSM 16973 = JCM 13450 TaxID=862515 RepID=E0NRD2_9BACT|nr:hypothetical protein HMPREF0658_0733 [Hoylesella marshii DSM 16973 = JCM 13450]